MCAAGGQDSDTLKLIACGSCLEVTSLTPLNSPVFNTAAYWYYTTSNSFGFSPTSVIDQYSADDIYKNDPDRLSWHIDIGVGGWRVGDVCFLNSDTTYYKYLFYKL